VWAAEHRPPHRRPNRLASLQLLATTGWLRQWCRGRMGARGVVASTDVLAGVGHPMGTRYPCVWRVWGDLRPDMGGRYGWRVVSTLAGVGVFLCPPPGFPLAAIPNLALAGRTRPCSAAPKPVVAGHNWPHLARTDCTWLVRPHQPNSIPRVHAITNPVNKSPMNKKC
jgi:hypothetical protein